MYRLGDTDTDVGFLDVSLGRCKRPFDKHVNCPFHGNPSRWNRGTPWKEMAMKKKFSAPRLKVESSLTELTLAFTSVSGGEDIRV